MLSDFQFIWTEAEKSWLTLLMFSQSLSHTSKRSRILNKTRRLTLKTVSLQRLVLYTSLFIVYKSVAKMYNISWYRFHRKSHLASFSFWPSCRHASRDALVFSLPPLISKIKVIHVSTWCNSFPHSHLKDALIYYVENILFLLYK